MAPARLRGYLRGGIARVRVAVIGMMSLADDISADLADATIDRIRVYGSLRGSKAALERIASRVARIVTTRK